jgi:SAM-dependent methyltransferase
MDAVMSTRTDSSLETCACPYCGGREDTVWANENGFTVVQCKTCEYLFLNPRPNADTRTKATELGLHGAANDMDISERRAPKKIEAYRRIFRAQFADLWSTAKPVTWLDIGAGYGEVCEAVAGLAPAGSKVVGLEPMKVKAAAARALGLDVRPIFLKDMTETFHVASLINVFSHINDFDSFLREISSALRDGGELFIETGDMTDLASRSDLPGDLGLPDHVAFAGHKHLKGFIERNGFEVISIVRAPIDDYLFTLKTVVKKAIGRNVTVKRPFSSPYRTMYVRARKRVSPVV